MARIPWHGVRSTQSPGHGEGAWEGRDVLSTWCQNTRFSLPPHVRRYRSVPREAGPAWGAWILEKIGMTLDEAALDPELFFVEALPHIKRYNKSGYRDVFPVGDKWQAKPYIRPKVQRGMGLYEAETRVDDKRVASCEMLCAARPDA